MHLNHYIARCGVCSRRKAVDLIKQGTITVNKRTVVDPSYTVQLNDVIRYNGKILSLLTHHYILLHKPKGVLTTTHDEKNRTTILDLLGNLSQKGLFPVGRLDKDTTGTLLITNDGALAQKLTHPRFEVKKVYQVQLDKPLAHAALMRLKRGVLLKDGRAQCDAITFPSAKNKRLVKVTLHSGKKHIIKRLFFQVGYNVESLDRINFAGLTHRGLKPGMWRFLTNTEIQRLKETATKTQRTIKKRTDDL